MSYPPNLDRATLKGGGNTCSLCDDAGATICDGCQRCGRCCSDPTVGHAPSCQTRPEA